VKIYLSQFLRLNASVTLFSNRSCMNNSAKENNKAILASVHSNKNGKDEDKGYVRINGRLILVTKSDLLNLIEQSKQRSKEDYLKKRFNSDFLSSLQSVPPPLFFPPLPRKPAGEERKERGGTHY
jgi:hypothetical protein